MLFCRYITENDRFGMAQLGCRTAGMAFLVTQICRSPTLDPARAIGRCWEKRELRRGSFTRAGPTEELYLTTQDLTTSKALSPVPITYKDTILG